METENDREKPKPTETLSYMYQCLKGERKLHHKTIVGNLMTSTSKVVR